MLKSSKCPNPSCNSNSFEAVQEQIKNYKLPVSVIRCESCKTVAGILPAKDAAEIAIKNQELLNEIKKLLSK